jgi:allantoin racemase
VPRRLLLLNANTTQAMTERMADAAAAQLGNRWIVAGRTAPFGEPYISSRRSYAIASHAVVAVADELAAQGATPDAVLIACFGDPGLMAAREILACPVYGMAEASCRFMIGLGRPYAIVTGGAAWAPMLLEFLKAADLEAHLAAIRTIELTGAQIAMDPEAAAGILAQAARLAMADDGAERILLGGAGLLGMAAKLRERGIAEAAESLSAALSWIADDLPEISSIVSMGAR